jgi:hypothetical protein
MTKLYILKEHRFKEPPKIVNIEIIKTIGYTNEPAGNQEAD